MINSELYLDTKTSFIEKLLAKNKGLGDDNFFKFFSNHFLNVIVQNNDKKWYKIQNEIVGEI